MKRTIQTVFRLAIVATALHLAACSKEPPADVCTAGGSATVGVYTVSSTDQMLPGDGIAYTMTPIDQMALHLFAQVMLTKASEQHCCTMKVGLHEGEYVVNYSRQTLCLFDAKGQREIATSDPDAIVQRMLVAALEGCTVEIVYDKRLGQWEGWRISSADRC